MAFNHAPTLQEPGRRGLSLLRGYHAPSSGWPPLPGYPQAGPGIAWGSSSTINRVGGNRGGVPVPITPVQDATLRNFDNWTQRATSSQFLGLDAHSREADVRHTRDPIRRSEEVVCSVCHHLRRGDIEVELEQSAEQQIEEEPRRNHRHRHRRISVRNNTPETSSADSSHGTPSGIESESEAVAEESNEIENQASTCTCRDPPTRPSAEPTTATAQRNESGNSLRVEISEHYLTCTRCDRKFDKWRNFDHHMQREHRIYAVAETMNVVRKKSEIGCMECGEYFAGFDALIKYQTHSHY